MLNTFKELHKFLETYKDKQAKNEVLQPKQQLNVQQQQIFQQQSLPIQLQMNKKNPSSNSNVMNAKKPNTDQYNNNTMKSTNQAQKMPLQSQKTIFQSILPAKGDQIAMLLPQHKKHPPENEAFNTNKQAQQRGNSPASLSQQSTNYAQLRMFQQKHSAPQISNLNHLEFKTTNNQNQQNYDINQSNMQAINQHKYSVPDQKTVLMQLQLQNQQQSQAKKEEDYFEYPNNANTSEMLQKRGSGPINQINQPHPPTTHSSNSNFILKQQIISNLQKQNQMMSMKINSQSLQPPPPLTKLYQKQQLQQKNNSNQTTQQQTIYLDNLVNRILKVDSGRGNKKEGQAKENSKVVNYSVQLQAQAQQLANITSIQQPNLDRRNMSIPISLAQYQNSYRQPHSANQQQSLTVEQQILQQHKLDNQSFAQQASKHMKSVSNLHVMQPSVNSSVSTSNNNVNEHHQNNQLISSRLQDVPGGDQNLIQMIQKKYDFNMKMNNNNMQNKQFIDTSIVNENNTNNAIINNNNSNYKKANNNSNGSNKQNYELKYVEPVPLSNLDLQNQSSSSNFKMQNVKNVFNFQYVIGKGGFGKVWKVENKKTKQIYALKEMSKAKIITKRSVNSVLNERNLLSTIRHDFLINMQSAFQDRSNLYLVMDYMSGGDLRFHIGRQRHFTEKQTKFFIANILIGLEFLHKKSIIHRDIKPENLVLDQHGYVHITDLGIARLLKPDNQNDTSGTPGYMAPEVMCRQNHGPLVDIFALGVICYEFMLGRRPYLGRSRKEIRDAILAKQVQIKQNEIPPDWTIESADFVNRMIQRKPMNRLGVNGIQEIKNHPWLRNFYWDKLIRKELKSPFIPNMNEDNFDAKQQITVENTEEELIQQNSLLLRRNSVQSLFNNYKYEHGPTKYGSTINNTHQQVQ